MTLYTAKQFAYGKAKDNKVAAVWKLDLKGHKPSFRRYRRNTIKFYEVIKMVKFKVVREFKDIEHNQHKYKVGELYLS